MAWVRLDDQVPRHQKTLKAGPAACWLWVCGIAHCQSQLTDGFISDEVLPMIGVDGGRVKRLAAVLVEVGLFERVEGGYRVHDYLEHNATAAEVKADKEWDRKRKELYADPALVAFIRQRDVNQCRYCGVPVNWTDRRGPRGGQFDHVQPRGSNHPDNVVVACRHCNTSKGGRTPEEAGMVLLPAPTRTSSGTKSGIGSELVGADGMGSDGMGEKRQERGFGGKPGRGAPLPGFPRLRIFRWMVDDFLATLGNRDFDLDGWLDRLEHDTSLVIPAEREARWKWLQQAFDFELRQAGLVSGPVSTEARNERVRELLKQREAHA